MEKFCTHCGNKVDENAIVCTSCGCAISQNNNSTTVQTSQKVQISLILGIIGIVFAWIFALVGHIASIIGIVIGIKEYGQTNKKTGLILSIVGEVCAILSSVIGVVLTIGAFM